MGREHTSNSNVPYNVYKVAAPSSSQGSVTGVSSYCGHDDDIFSDLNTDLHNIAGPAPSSSLSVLMGDASDDDDIVFPKFNSPLWPSDDDLKFFMNFINEQSKVDEYEELKISSLWDENLEPRINEGECQSSNLLEKDINEEDILLSSPLSTCRGENLEPRIYEGECQSSDLLEKDVNEEDILLSSLLSTFRDEKFETNKHKKKCQSYKSHCFSKTTKPVDNALVPDSDVMLADKSISNLPEKNINEKDALPDEKLECNLNKRKCQRSQRSYPSEMVKTFEDEELQPDNHRTKCQGSQTNNPSKMMKQFDGMIKEDAVPDSAPSKHEDEKLEPDNNKRKYQSSQSNYYYPSKTKKTFDNMPASNSNVMITIENISNLPEKDTDEEDAVQSLFLSMHRDEKLEHNNHKLKCGTSQTNCPYKMAKPFSNAMASKSDGMIAGKSISNFAEKEIDKENAQPDEKLEPRNYEGECQSSQSNCSSKTTKPLEDTLVSNSKSTIAGKSISNLPEKDINAEDVLSSALLSTCCRDEKLEPINHKKRKCQSYRSNCSSKTKKLVDNMLVPDSNGVFAGKSISNLPEKNINEHDALPDEKLEPDNHKRKYQSSQSNYPSKTKKTFDNMPASSSDVKITSENISNFPEEGSDEEIVEAGSSLSNIGVKLRIKPFTVPEFFVEIPETATVSFLKRKIMEKATATVGGAHVGILLQGKKIRDENKTLSETDISSESRLDVILEPIPSQARYSCPLQLPCGLSQPLTRYSPTPVVHRGTSDTSPDPLLCNSRNFIQGDYDLVESQTNMLIGKNITSMEVIALPATSVEPQDVASVHQKSNSFKNVQHRNSEFFSLSEVEALVQAVEKLGTGRWKKIKEQAFGNASNRKHTDLKDKWRSLLKTAKIPAKKRRAVVLPQELLDRVLAVETHNSLQQGMQQ